MDFYLIRYLYNNAGKICIWYSDDKDGLCTNEDKKIVSFSNIDTATLYLSKKSLSLCNTNNIDTYDFDKLKFWINSDDSAVDCEESLNLWNIFTDAAFAIGLTFKGDTKNKPIRLIYDKLFFGCNLLKPSSEEDFVPTWNKRQISTLKSVLEDGLNMFVGNIECLPAV